MDHQWVRQVCLGLGCPYSITRAGSADGRLRVALCCWERARGNSRDPGRNVEELAECPDPRLRARQGGAL